MLTYIAYVTYTDPDNGLPVNATTDISFALVRTGENARTVWISGEQVFKYASDSAVAVPAQITLTANLQNVTMGKWQYKTAAGDWADYPTTSDNASITAASLVVKPGHAIWVGDAATLRVTTSDANVGDTTSIYKVSDGAAGSSGAAGQSAPVVFLTNESVAFAANAAGQVPAITAVCNVVAYSGATKVVPTVGTVSGAPAGMTVSKGEATNQEIPLTIAIAAGSTLGGSGQQQGALSVPITAPVSTTLTIHWTKVNTGAAGASAVVFTVYAPQGTVFTNGEGTLLLQTAAYDGSAPIDSGAAYLWEKYVSGSWNPLPGESGSSLSVDGASVAGMASYRCTMTYGGRNYQDVITLIDKTDNYQLDIDSSAGDVFKNGIGETVMTARLWQNGIEVDALKSTTYAVTAPSSPAVGDYYYKITKSMPQMALMRYSGSEWVNVTEQAAYKHAKTYTWYRRDKDGQPMDGGSAFATGKTIFVDGDDVDSKTVFVCEVQ